MKTTLTITTLAAALIGLSVVSTGASAANLVSINDRIGAQLNILNESMEMNEASIEKQVDLSGAYTCVAGDIINHGAADQIGLDLFTMTISAKCEVQYTFADTVSVAAPLQGAKFVLQPLDADDTAFAAGDDIIKGWNCDYKKASGKSDLEALKLLDGSSQNVLMKSKYNEIAKCTAFATSLTDITGV